MSLQSYVKRGGSSKANKCKPELWYLTETDTQRCSVKKVFLKISQNSQENSCARASFLIKLQACNFVKKEILPQVFSCKFCEILGTPFFIGHLWGLLLYLRDETKTHASKEFFISSIKTFLVTMIKMITTSSTDVFKSLSPYLYNCFFKKTPQNCPFCHYLEHLVTKISEILTSNAFESRELECHASSFLNEKPVIIKRIITKEIQLGETKSLKNVLFCKFQNL